jgi:hypothetical protein
VVDAPVLDRAPAGPGVEDSDDRLVELNLRVLREGLAGLLLEELLELLGQLLQLARLELHVLGDAGVLLALLDEVLVALARDAAGDVPEHLHEAAVGVPREALVAGRGGEALDRLVVEAEVEHRVEHARHRLAGAAPHGYEQRVVLLAKLAPGLLLEPFERGGDLLLRQRLAVHVADARLGGDREARRHPLGAEHACHLGHA